MDMKPSNRSSYRKLVEREKDFARELVEAVNAERAACAQVCSELLDEIRSRRLSKVCPEAYYDGESMGAARCMSSIRSRGAPE